MFVLHRNRDPVYQNTLEHYNTLCKEMDALLTPTLYLLQHLTPRVVTPKEDGKSRNFEVKMCVKDFLPNELSVKLSGSGDELVIEGKHEERQDNEGYISRHIVRRFTLPQDIKPESLLCNLSSDGILHVTAERAIKEKKSDERSVPINFTGQPAASVIDNSKTEQVQAKTAAEKLGEENPSQETRATSAA